MDTAFFENVYEEHVGGFDPDWDFVSVELCCWWKNGVRDHYVLKHYIIVEGKEISSMNVFSGYEHRGNLLRRAISQFDNDCKSHPCSIINKSDRVTV